MAVLDKVEKKSPVTRQAISFDLKITWLAIAKMFGPLAQEHDATVATAFALLVIHPEKGTRATKIAPYMGMEPRSLSRLLNKLEEDKLIERRADPDDKRSVRVFLTKKGLRQQQLAKETVGEFHTLIAKRVSADKLETFYDVLEEIHGVINDFNRRNGG
jgi:DNA-binding MarR family transcriptional regulator